MSSLPADVAADASRNESVAKLSDLTEQEETDQDEVWNA